MRGFILFGVAILVWQGQSQCIPRLPLAIPQPQITTPVVASTIIDNSVSNALANAIQLLIVSNLIENTMNKNGPCDSVPICPNIIPEIIGPICEPITIAPYDIVIPSCDPVIPNVCFSEVIPNYSSDCGNPIQLYPVTNCDSGNFYPVTNCDCGNYYPVTNCDCGKYYPVTNCDCGNYYPVTNCDCGKYYAVTNCDCGKYYPVTNCDCGKYYPVPNIGCDCSNCYPSILPVTNIGCDCPNYYPASLPNIACDMPNYYPVPSCDCNYYPMPNLGCDQPLYPSFGPMYPCNTVGPVTAEVLFPTSIPVQLNCNLGCNNIVPTLPCPVNVEPRIGYIEPCGKPCGNGFYR